MPPKKTTTTTAHAKKDHNNERTQHEDRNRQEAQGYCPDGNGPGEIPHQSDQNGRPHDSVGDRPGIRSGHRPTTRHRARQVDLRSATAIVQVAPPTCGGPGLPACTGPAPLLQKGHEVAWWFVFKFNSKVFPGCGGDAKPSCPFGGEPQSYKNSSQQFVYASSDSPTLQQGSGCAGDSTEMPPSIPIGATFDEVYHGSYHYVVWNDQFYDDPDIARVQRVVWRSVGPFQGHGGVERRRRGPGHAGVNAVVASRRERLVSSQERWQYAGLREGQRYPGQPAFLCAPAEQR